MDSKDEEEARKAGERFGKEVGELIVTAFSWAFIAGIVYVAVNGTILGLKWAGLDLVPGPCLEKKTIAQVGGCDFFGDCGVRYDDNTTGKERKPVAGAQVCSYHAKKDLSEEDAKALAWATENPDDYRSAKVLRRLRLQDAK